VYFAADMTTVRLENEIILDVPDNNAEELWIWLQDHYTETCVIESIVLQCERSTENFHDTYFDNPDAQLAREKTSFRYRRRFFEDESTKEWIQFKVTLEGEKTTREEMKFDVRQNEKVNEEYDAHPLLRLVRRRDRENVLKTLQDYGFDALKVRPSP